MARVVWAVRAENDVDCIIAYIRQFDPMAATLMAVQIRALAESLTEFPERGRPASDGVRELTNVRPYVLRHRVIEDVVLIVRVRHGRRRPLR